MKCNFPIQLILITLLLGLSVAGRFFVDSCKQECVELVTTVGDASLLEDTKIAITYNSTTTTYVRLESNLLVNFKDGPVVEKVVPGIAPKAPKTLGLFEVNPDPKDTCFRLDTYYPPFWNSSQPFPIGSLIVEEIHAQSRWPEFDVRTIKIGDIYYFTLETHALDNYGSEYTDDYTAQSGIWAYYETPSDDGYSHPEVHLENVVPYTVTGPSGASEVYGLYATEDETALVLITVENRTDLYATFYDIQTKTASTPRLVYHCENVRIFPQILSVNSTCPSGSILIAIVSDDENNPITYHALGLRENEVTGEIQIIDYPMDNFNWRWLSGLEDYEILRIVGAGEKVEMYGISDIYYVDDELWIISYEHRNDYFFYRGDYRGEPFVRRYVDSDSGDKIVYPGQLRKEYEYLIQEYLIQGYRDNSLFYEGVLSVDLTVANPELRFLDNVYGYPIWNNVSAQATLLYE
ncbi:MAG: hypothetical protein GXY06_01355 [Clostridiaceae bacterium]|nr:hypothetical protein [Clostridiaceae bacterium]